MKNTIKLIVMLAILSAAAAHAGAPAVVRTLDNGMSVVVKEDHSTDLVAVDIWVRAGSVNETDETNGVSHFIEHLLFRATDKRGPGQIDMEIESLGASAEARTSRDWAHFYTVVARRYVDKALDVLSDAVTHPLFREEDIDHERLVILDEIARKESDPWKVLFDRVYATSYSTHPYRLPIEGTQQSIGRITRKMIVDHYHKLYTTENMAVVLVGDMTPDDGVAAVKKAFAGFKNRRYDVQVTTNDVQGSTNDVRGSLDPGPARTEPANERIRMDTSRSYLAVAFPAPSVKDRPDVFAMDVLLSYLGVGYQSWLASELRDQQKLALEVSSDFLTQRDRGLAIISISTETKNVEKARDAILAKIADLRATPISESDLARAKRSLEGGYAFDVETYQGLATSLGFYEAIDTYALTETYVSHIRAVTSQDIAALAKKYLDPNQAVVVVLGP